MRTSFIVILFLIGALFPQQESPELKEAAALTESVMRLAKEGKLDEALSFAKRAFEIREKLLPRTDPLVAQSLSFVADLQIAKREYGPAKTSLQRLLKLQEERFGPDDVNLARIHERLGFVYLSDGSVDKAEGEYKLALQLNEKKLGPENLQVADDLVGLATVYRAKDDFRQGAPLFKRALAIYARLSGVNSPAFDQTSVGFTCLAHQTGNREATKEIDEIWKQFAPAGSPSQSPYTEFLNAKALSLPKPDYPPEAKARRISGTVVMRVKIDEKGQVIDARDMCQGSPYLSPGALASVWKARFAPTIINDKPVKVDGIVAYRYVSQ